MIPRLVAVLFVVAGYLIGLGSAVGQSYASPVAVGVVSASEITEASGLIASRQNPGVLWTHNDSGWPGTVFAIATNGPLIARYTIPNAFFGDYEDISFGPGPDPDHQYIYLGDIGDNYLTRTFIRVFRFPEPAVYTSQTNSPPTDYVVGAQEITLTYPDGPFNAEAMMVDPLTGDLFIATKLTNSSRIYRATRAEMDSGDSIVLTFIREITFFKVSGADISADGRLILLRRGGKGSAWTRSTSQSVGDALGANPSNSNIPIPAEPNGEAIAIHPTGLGYYTISEGLYPTNYYCRRTDSGAPRQPVVFVRPGESWRFQDLGTDAGTAWRQSGYNDTNWSSGPAQLGYGQGDEQTVVSFGLDDFAKYVTTYFRKTFTKASSINVTNLALRLCFTDGVAVYLNGTEVLRRNLAADARFDQPALASNSAQQNYWTSVPVNPALLRTGTNTIAVELHRLDPTGPDLSFDLQLGEGAVELPVRFTKPPELVGGQWRLSLGGPAGSMVTVEACADLQNWSAVGRVILTNGVGLFQEPAGSGTDQRLYRLRH